MTRLFALPSAVRGTVWALWWVLLIVVGIQGVEAQQPATVGTGAFGPARRGGAVYPAQEIPLRFDHGKHLAKGMQCAQCHQGIATSKRAADLNLPGGEVCDDCHGEAHPSPAPDAPACSTCHTRTEGRKIKASVHMPTPRLRFNHQLHGSTSCETCHGDMSKVRLATELQLPKEQVCLDCHDGTKATERCAACHPADAGGKVLTRPFADRTAPPLVPRGRSAWGADHDLAFVEDHAGPAKANPQLCQSCHDEAECQDCHGGVLRPLRIHSGDYMTLHAMDARANTQNCDACHRRQTECFACHQRMGLVQGDDSAFGVGSSLRFHPEGWAGPPGSPQGHAFPAQRNVGTCVSCHGEDTCLSCHATTDATRPGLSVSPHGSNFGDSIRCQTLVSRNRRVCLKCHAPGDPMLDCL